MPRPERLGGGVFLYPGDCLKSLDRMKENSIDAVVTDPPYHLVSIVKRMSANDAAPVGFGSDGRFQRMSKGFMGQTWDGGDVAFRKETWEKVYRVMKPGAHLVAFGSTRNYHRLVCAIEDAGFEIRDAISWLYGSGFPKSHDVSKGIDKKKNAKRKVVGEWKQPGRNKRTFINNAGLHLTSDSGEITEPATPESEYWDGWGTALKPGMELVCLARKPLSEKTVAANVLKWGTGALNIDACRIGSSKNVPASASKTPNNIYGAGMTSMTGGTTSSGFDPNIGRWPANVTHDGSIEVVEAFPVVGDSHPPCNEGSTRTNQIYGEDNQPRTYHPGFADSGSAARFFYSAKADSDDRLGFHHPTVKPVDLKQWLVRLITPEGGFVLDPFSGTGTTGEAAWREKRKAVLMEAEPKYQDMIRRRVEVMLKGSYERAIAKMTRKTIITGSLFVSEDTDSTDGQAVLT